MLFLSIFCSASLYHLYLKLSSSQGHRTAANAIGANASSSKSDRRESEHFKQES